MVQPILSFKKISNERQSENFDNTKHKNFDQKTIWFNPYCLLREFSPKENIVQPTLSFKTVLTKR